MKTETLDKVLKLIANANDVELAMIYEATKRRTKILRSQETQRAMNTFQVGDQVCLKNLRPQYMNGARGHITARKQTKFVVQLHDGTLFRGRSSIVTVPASCLDSAVD